MAFGKFKRIIYSCSDPQGLLVVGCRVNRAETAARIYLTDLQEDGKALIELGEKPRMIDGDIAISDTDLSRIAKVVLGKPIPLDDLIDDAILNHFQNA